MPSSSGVNAANNQITNFQQLLNMFLGIAQGNTNISSAAFNQFLGGTGPFASSLIGMNGTEDLLAQLQSFRQNLQNPLTNLSLPGPIQGFMSQLNGPLSFLQQTLGNMGQTADTSAIRDGLNTIFNGMTGPQAGQQALADRILGSWGMTGSMGSGLEAAQALLQNGGFNAGLENLANVGGSIVNNRGYGPETQGALDFFSNIMANGGRDAGTQALTNRGAGLFDAGGMTPQMSSLLNQLQSGIASGGMTPEASAFMTQLRSGIAQNGMTPQSQQLFDAAMKLISANGQGGALLPMQTVVQMSRDQAATAANQSAEAARRSAMQRQGGSIASGTTESALGEFSDAAMRAEADAVRGAAVSQQDLQLKQLLGAMGIGADVSKTASGLTGAFAGAGADVLKSALGLTGQFAGAGADVLRSAAANVGSAADLMKAGEGLAATRMGQGISGFQDTIANTIARLGLGSQMVTGANQGASARLGLGLSGVNNINSLASTNQFNAAQLLQGLTQQSLGASQGLTNLTGLELANNQDAYRSLASLLGLGNSMYTGQQQMGLASNAQQIDAFLQSLGISSNISNAFTNNWFGAANGLTNIGQGYSSLIPGAMNGMSDMGQWLIRAQMQPGFWGQFAQNALGGLVGGITGGLGSWLTGGLLGGGTGGRGYATTGVTSPGFSGSF